MWFLHAFVTPVDSSIGRPPFSLRWTRADKGWMKRYFAQLVRGLRRREGPAVQPRESRCRTWRERPRAIYRRHSAAWVPLANGRRSRNACK